MTETILALLVAIRVVESTDGLDPKAHGNNYQITSVCVWDVNRIYGTRYRWPEDVRDEETAQNIAFLYLSYYADQYRKDYGRVPTKATLARIWNKGYTGMKRGEGHGNNYQITSVCVWDVNRIYGTRYRWPEDVRDEETAQNIAFLYLSYYADQYRRDYGRVPTKATLARIWNKGYTGMKRGEGHGYAAKVAKAERGRRVK